MTRPITIALEPVRERQDEKRLGPAMTAITVRYECGCRAIRFVQHAEATPDPQRDGRRCPLCRASRRYEDEMALLEVRQWYTEKQQQEASNHA